MSPLRPEEASEAERRVVTAQAIYEMSMATANSLLELKGEQALTKQSVDHVAATLARIEAAFKETALEAASRLSEVKLDLKEDISTQDKRITRVEDKVDGLSRKVWGLSGMATALGALIGSLVSIITRGAGG